MEGKQIKFLLQIGMLVFARSTYTKRDWTVRVKVFLQKNIPRTEADLWPEHLKRIWEGFFTVSGKRFSGSRGLLDGEGRHSACQDASACNKCVCNLHEEIPGFSPGFTAGKGLLSRHRNDLSLKDLIQKALQKTKKD